MTPEQFRALGHQMVDWIARYMAEVEHLPVAARVSPGDILAQLPEHPPQEGLEAIARAGAAPERPHARQASWSDIFADLDQIIVPGLTHWQSPNFFGYFPCNASGPAILGELLSAGLNVNGMLWATSPAATELEIRVMDWMGAMLGLPDAFNSSGGSGGGVIQGTASESTLIAMLAARQRFRRQVGQGQVGQGQEATGDEKLVVYTSEHAHSSVVKAAMIAGIARSSDDRRRIRLIDVDEKYSLRADLLARAIEDDLAAGLSPFYICATIGTTSTTAVDPLLQIAEVLEKTRFQKRGGWLHVDAAHAGAACICPEFRWMLEGVQHADSFCFNPHKWLLTNFDCDCFWTRDRAALIDALSITPEYLRNRASESGLVVDYRDWQIPLGRRFRALKLWLVIRHYGVRGLQAYIREHVRLAALFEQLVAANPRFELVAPRTVNLVCFRMRGEGELADARNRELLERLNASGNMLLTHSALNLPGQGMRYILRMAIGSSGTEERHVREAWKQISAAADEIGESL